MKLGRFDTARDDIEAAIAMASDWVLPYVNRAKLAHAHADHAAALADYSRIIDRLRAKPDPNERLMLARRLLYRGQEQRSHGDPIRAEEDRREAVLLDPKLAGP